MNGSSSCYSKTKNSQRNRSALRIVLNPLYNLECNPQMQVFEEAPSLKRPAFMEKKDQQNASAEVPYLFQPIQTGNRLTQTSWRGVMEWKGDIPSDPLSSSMWPRKNKLLGHGISRLSCNKKHKMFTWKVDSVPTPMWWWNLGPLTIIQSYLSEFQGASSKGLVKLEVKSSMASSQTPWPPRPMESGQRNDKEVPR